MPEEKEEVIGPDGRIDTSKQAEVTPPPVNDPPKVDVDLPEEKKVDDDSSNGEEDNGAEGEEKEELAVSLDDFLTVKDGEAPKKEEVKTEVKTEDKVPPETKIVDKKGPRDVSDLDEKYQSFFKKDMSNKAYETLKPIVLEHKKLKEDLAAKEAELAEAKKGALPDSYYDNPKSILLAPEYENLVDLVDQAQLVSDHWKKQLVAVRKGDNKYQHLMKDAKGQFVLKETDVTDETETELQEILGFASNQTQKFQGKLEALIESHSTKVKDSVAAIKQMTLSTFPIFDHPEKGKALKPIVDDVIRKFPAVIRNSPAAELLARSLVTNHKLSEILQGFKAASGKVATNKSTTVKDDKRRAGPTAGEATGGGKGNGEPEVSVDDFKKAME